MLNKKFLKDIKRVYKLVYQNIKEDLTKKKQEDFEEYNINLVNLTNKAEEEFLMKNAIVIIIKLIVVKYYQQNSLCTLQNNNLLLNFDKIFKDSKLVVDFFQQYNLLQVRDSTLKQINQILQAYNFKSIEDNFLGKLYQYLSSQNYRKKSGKFYTPVAVINFILEETIANISIIDNPYIKILDPACGSGDFLVKIYNLLYEKYLNNLEQLQLLYPEKKWSKDMIHQHILTNNLYAVDLDSIALALTALNLINKNSSNLAVELNLYQQDMLKTEFNEKFDFIIGNPPYIGHKQVDKDYKRWLRDNYQVYVDKADLSYCFLERGVKLLKEEGELMLISSRYFLEAATAKKLRTFLQDNTDILFLLDFYGLQVFDDAIINSVIIRLRAKSKVKNLLEIFKIKQQDQTLLGTEILTDIAQRRDKDYYDHFKVSQSDLESEGWRLMAAAEDDIIKIVEDNSEYTLGEICNSYQGVITGYDRAFIFSKAELEKLSLADEFLKPWIKNSQIEAYVVNPSQDYLLYTDQINNIDDFPKIKTELTEHKERLSQRRECQRGLKEWYRLQWGRTKSIFTEKKVIYPYKAAHNRFAIDDSANYCSADVYLLELKEEYQCLLDLEFLVGILNSKLYEFYFKSFAKKMTYKLYDYYPNKVLKLKLNCENKSEISTLVKKIIKLKKELKAFNFVDKLKEIIESKKDKLEEEYIKFDLKQKRIKAEIKDLENIIDFKLYQKYNLNIEGIKLIKERLGEIDYGLVELDYLKKEAVIDYNSIIKNRGTVANALAEKLSWQQLKNLHYEQAKTLNKIALSINCEYQTLVYLELKYRHNNPKDLQAYNYQGLELAIQDYLAEKLVELLAEEGSYLSIEELYQRLRKSVDLDQLLKLSDSEQEQMIIIKDIIFSRKYTWREYQERRRKKLKLSLPFINYKGYQIALSSWDSEHQSYFAKKG